MKEEDLVVVRALLRDPNITVEDVAKRMRVSPLDSVSSLTRGS